MIRSTSHTRLKISLKIMKEIDETAISSASFVQWFTSSYPLHNKHILVASERYSKRLLRQVVPWCCVWYWSSYSRRSYKWTMLRTWSMPSTDCIHAWPQNFTCNCFILIKGNFWESLMVDLDVWAISLFCPEWRDFQEHTCWLGEREYRAKQLWEMVP